MGNLSEFGSATAIILLSLMLASTASSQSETDSVAVPIINVSDTNVGSAINQYPALVLDCYKIGCGPCEEMGAALGEIAQDFQGKITFGRINIKENLKTKAKYKISGYPTLLLFEDGILVDRIVGFTSKESIEDEIASITKLESQPP
jgi:thioredoxin 1